MHCPPSPLPSSQTSLLTIPHYLHKPNEPPAISLGSNSTHQYHAHPSLPNQPPHPQPPTPTPDKTTQTPTSRSSFLIRRGTHWFEPGAPFPPPFTPTGQIPSSRDAYSSWLHRHHAMTALPARERQGDSATIDSGCGKAASGAPPTDKNRRRWTASWMPSWTRRNNRIGGGGGGVGATFRVWEQPAPSSAAADAGSDGTDGAEGQGGVGGGGRGRWVEYPSVLITEGTVDAEEARYRARVARGLRPDRRGGRKCQPGISRWMCGAIIVGLPVLIPVALGMVAVEKGRDWWRERRREKKKRGEMVRERKQRNDMDQEQAVRWKVEGWGEEGEDEDEDLNHEAKERH